MKDNGTELLLNTIRNQDGKNVYYNTEHNELCLSYVKSASIRVSVIRFRLDGITISKSAPIIFQYIGEL